MKLGDLVPCPSSATNAKCDPDKALPLFESPESWWSSCRSVISKSDVQDTKMLWTQGDAFSPTALSLTLGEKEPEKYREYQAWDLPGSHNGTFFEV